MNTGMSWGYAPDARSYQWRRNGIGLPGETRSWLAIGAASLADAGTYDVLVYGSGTAYVLSEPATLAVYPAGTLIRVR